MNLKRLIPCILTILTSLSSLGLAQGFDRRALLENIAYNIMMPCHEDFLAQAEALEQAVTSLWQTPSEDTVLAAQTAWRAADTVWASCEFFTLDDLNLTILHNQIDKRVNISIIDHTVGKPDAITLSTIQTSGANSKGLGALEYLLFDPDGNVVVLSMLDDSQRLDYALATAEALRISAEDLRTFWLPEGFDYAAEFVGADGSGMSVSSSINRLLNIMIAELEDVVHQKLGRPLGNFDGGTPQPQGAESHLSENSQANLLANLDALETLFTGGEGLGFDDYLDYVGAEYNGQPFSNTFSAALNNARLSIGAIEQPLSQAVYDDAASVKTAFDTTRLLIPLLKADMANHLGITVTYSDNDGDS